MDTLKIENFKVIDLVEFTNILDRQGLFKDAQIIDNYLIKCAKAKRVPNYRNIAIAVSPLVAAMLWSYIHHKNPQSSHNVPTFNHVKRFNPTNYKHNQLPKGNYKNFEHFISRIEGGLSNRNKTFDPGGLTNRGITQETYDRYRKDNKLSHQSVEQLTDDERNEIIKERYWNPIKGDLLPNGIAMVIADWKFNGGSPIRNLQKILRIPITGRMDDSTVKSVWQYVGDNKSKEKELAQKLISARQKYLESLKTTRNNKKVPLIHFNRGWYNRLNDLKSEINSIS
jgi:lysozyme family protein